MDIFNLLGLEDPRHYQDNGLEWPYLGYSWTYSRLRDFHQRKRGKPRSSLWHPPISHFH